LKRSANKELSFFKALVTVSFTNYRCINICTFVLKGYIIKGGRKPTYLTSATSISAFVKAVGVVPSGNDKTDVRRENTDVRWVGFHPLYNF
jgi:hypothetical protein